MQTIVNENGQAHSDLSKRLADNVVQQMVAYMESPGFAAADKLHAHSTALSALSLLAIAEQLQELVTVLTQDDQDKINLMEMWR